MLSCYVKTNFRFFSSALCPASSSTSLQFKLRHDPLWEAFPNALPSPTAGCVPQQGIQGVLHSVTVHLLVSLVDGINLHPMIQYGTLSGTIYNMNNLIDSSWFLL